MIDSNYLIVVAVVLMLLNNLNYISASDGLINHGRSTLNNQVPSSSIKQLILKPKFVEDQQIKDIQANDIKDHNEPSAPIHPLKQLEQQLAMLSKRQQVAEKDHFMMQKWLVDNINDLHRELKQTETDFDHYTQVTKSIVDQNESRFKQQLAAALSLPLYLINTVQTSGRLHLVNPSERLMAASGLQRSFWAQ